MAELSVECVDVDEGAVTRVLCAGEVDASTSDELDKALSALLARGKERIVLDLTGVSYMASRGLGVLLKARKVAAERSGGLVLVNPSEVVRSAIEVLGFDAVFDIARSEGEAVEMLRG